MKLVIGKQIVNIVSAYAPQVGLSAEEKDDFWDSFIIVLSGIPKQESIFIGRDMNGHVRRDARNKWRRNVDVMKRKSNPIGSTKQI